MKIYQVGGSLRDELLGLEVRDRDWVVVGATPEHMMSLGYRPVGRDFPVFLHPRTNEEYALARTERKTAPGYHGFSFHAAPDVTLEDDLQRRDLTINAIARGEDGVLVDPFNGQADLRARVFRHVSDAFVEDPVRILRIARFAARFSDFSIAPETLALMRSMVNDGEVDALVPERVWQEVSRGLMESTPSRMFDVLRACGALKRLAPELDALWGVPQGAEHHPEVDTGVHVMMVIDASATLGHALPTRFAALLHDLGKGATDPQMWPRHHGHEARSVKLARDLCERWRVPVECRDLALIVARDHGNLMRIGEMRAATVVDLLERVDAFRRPERFHAMLDACEADQRGRLGMFDRPFVVREPWLSALAAARGVDAGAIAAEHVARPTAIREAVRAARVRAVAGALGK
ncbi:MAG TPA: multifunctional CCA addition/repair protein [Burkholderiaceae bacterium]|nr:multifunctional CCA addition/repair protein [Burkholderiaceae bacterium]